MRSWFRHRWGALQQGNHIGKGEGRARWARDLMGAALTQDTLPMQAQVHRKVEGGRQLTATGRAVCDPTEEASTACVPHCPAGLHIQGL